MSSISNNQDITRIKRKQNKNRKERKTKYKILKVNDILLSFKN
jgi:hypothetical protein